MGRPKGALGKSPKKRKAKDPNKPKRPTSAYFYFAADQRAAHLKAGKKITRVADWTKEVSAKWRELSDADKVPFEKKAKVDKARYDSEMAAYSGKDSNKPKRPQSAYFLWLADFRKENKHKFEGENKELLRAAGEAWKDLDDEEKKPYEKGAEEERRKYEAAMKEYNKSGGASPAKKAKVAAPAAANGTDDDDEEDEEEEDEEEEEEDDEEDDE